MKCLGAMGSIVACYGIYACSNPGADGVIFGSILAAVTGLAGYTVAVARQEPPPEE